MLLICLSTKTYLSSQLLVYLLIHVPVHDHTCSFSYFNSYRRLRSTRYRFYCAATPCLPVYLHASLSSNHKELPVTTTTCVHAHRCTCSGPYLFTFILKFQLTAKVYPSTFLLRLHVHSCIRSPVYLFRFFLLFRHNLHSDVSTHLPWYVHRDLPGNTFTCLSSCFTFV